MHFQVGGSCNDVLRNWITRCTKCHRNPWLNRWTRGDAWPRGHLSKGIQFGSVYNHDNFSSMVEFHEWRQLHLVGRKSEGRHLNHFYGVKPCIRGKNRTTHSPIITRSVNYCHRDWWSICWRAALFSCSLEKSKLWAASHCWADSLIFSYYFNGALISSERKLW